MKLTTSFLKFKRASVLTLLFVIAAVPTHATVYFVDDARPNDTGDGLSWLTAMKQIQTAIDSSMASDTLLVKYGTYSITTDLVLTSNRKMTTDDGTKDSWETAVYNADTCIIDAGASGRVLTVTNSEVTDDTEIRGFTFTGGVATAESPAATYGGGVYVGDGADPEFHYCRVTGNTANTGGTGYGGGVACVGDGTEPSFYFCTIDSNLASSAWYGYGGGTYFFDVSYGFFDHTEISGNTASSARVGYGGGLYSSHSTLAISATKITYNVAATQFAADGGGVYVYKGDVEIGSCEIDNNRATEGPSQGNGGGVRTVGSGFFLMQYTYVRNNVASSAGAGNGGGLYCASGHSEIFRNSFSGNVAAGTDGDGNGGGIFMATSIDDVVRDGWFLDNTASRVGLGKGGGLYASSDFVIDRNIFAYNRASALSEGYGGACYFTNTWSQVFTNNTVYRNANTASFFGSGVGSGLYHDAWGSGMTIDNNIFAGHSLQHSDSLAMFIPGPVTARYTCFYDNPAGNYSVGVTSTNEVLGDPRFTEPSDTTADFSLMYDSPCIEAGDPAYPVPNHGGAWVVDLGAIEYTDDRHWRPVTGTGELLFGGTVKAKVNVTTLGTLSEIDMVVNGYEYHPMAPWSVRRWYAVDHVGDGMTFDLVLTYFDRELGYQDEENLAMWRWTDTDWDGPKPTTVDTTGNIATVTGLTEFSDWILTDGQGPTSAGAVLPRTQLSLNYPNPFNPITTISYQLAGRSHVRLVIYNVSGRVVRVLVNAERSGGHHGVVWDGRDHRGRVVASGIYFCRLTAGDFVQTRKMVLVK